MNRFVYLIVLMVVVCISSCYSPRYVYSPVAHNVPVLLQKGDSKLGVQYSHSLGGKTKLKSADKDSHDWGLDVQGAYAITNHLAVQGSYAYRSEQNFADFNVNTFDTSTINYQRQLTEFGLGYYMFSRRSHQSMFQVFAGAGLGTSEFTDKYPIGNNGIHSRFVKMNIRKLFLQPAFMIRYGNSFATSLSSRISVINFRKFSTDYTMEELHSYQLTNLSNSTEIFWEPAFVNTIGFKNLPGLQLEFQFGMAFLISQNFVDYRTFSVSAGVAFDFAKLFRQAMEQPKKE
jgi:hypothetical protein